MLNIDKSFKDPRLLSALTGVTITEFNNILPDFEKEWVKAKKQQHKKNAKERKMGGGRKWFPSYRGSKAILCSILL